MVTDSTEKFLVYLNMLHTLSVSEKAIQTQNAIRSIVKLLNYEYFRQNEVVMLSEEIAHAKVLVDTFKVRFGSKLNFMEYIEDSALTVYVPHFTVMAFVENALKHGLEPKEGNWELELKVCLNHENITIIIIDSGVGFNTDLILSEAQKETEASGSIKSVVSRLKSYFNGLCNVEIKSCPSSGTTVKINLPL